MDLITSSEMSVVDINCEYFGLSRLQLMENAGRALASELLKRFRKGKVIVVAGKGNNGGDAFVMARHLKNFDVEIFILGKISDIKTSEARKNLQILVNGGYKITEIRDSAHIPEFSGNILVDAILGTGVKGSLKDPEKTAVEKINEADIFTLSVDVPTGLDPDTGEGELAVQADLTVTFHKAKPGLITENAKRFVGEMIVADIGIPKSFEKMIGVGEVKVSYKRDTEGHKGTHGKILVIGGGPYTGAPVLTGLAALRGGVDLAVLVVPEKISKVVASYSPDLIVRSYPGDHLTPEALPYIYPYLETSDVVAIGMGLGRENETIIAVREILEKCKKAVVDADALRALDFPLEKNIILTPHEGEFKRLFNPISWDTLQEKSQEVERWAKEIGATIILKNPIDVVSNGKMTKINLTGNAGMTVGGTGDVMAGVVSAFFAMSSDTFHAACAGAFITGLAGDKAYERMGYNFTATDVIQYIPEAIKESLSFG
jgi:NAD(P)H-hydrate epimerase